MWLTWLDLPSLCGVATERRTSAHLSQHGGRTTLPLEIAEEVFASLSPVVNYNSHRRLHSGWCLQSCISSGGWTKLVHTVRVVVGDCVPAQARANEAAAPLAINMLNDEDEAMAGSWCWQCRRRCTTAGWAPSPRQRPCGKVPCIASRQVPQPTHNERNVKKCQSL